MVATKTLVLDFREITTALLGSGQSGWFTDVSVAYDRDVRWSGTGTGLPDHGIYPGGVPFFRSSLSLVADMQVPVIPNDDPDLLDGSAGFGITVTLTLSPRHTARGHRTLKYERTIVVTSADPATLNLSSRGNASPLPPELTDLSQVAEAIARFNDAAEIVDDRAEAAVAEQVAASDLVTGSDPRLPQARSMTDIAFTISDEAGNRSWVEGTTAGHPTAFAASEIASVVTDPLGLRSDPNAGPGFHVADESGLHLAEVSTDGAGKVYGWASERIARRGQAYGARLPVTAFTCWGDSLTFGQGAGGARWGDVMAAQLGIPATVMGYPANGSANIAFRSGGLPLSLSADVTIAPGQTVTVTPTITTGWRVGGNLTLDMPCKVTASNGTGADGSGSMVTVTGLTLRQNVGASTVGTFSLIRAAGAGSAVTIPAGMPLVGTEGDGLNGGGLVLLLGRNNIDSPDAIVRDVTAIIGHNTRTPRQYIIVPPTGSRNSGASDLVKIRSITAQLTAIYGPHVADLQTWLASTASLAAVGVTATSDDTADIAAGWIPRSLIISSDTVHYNANGHKAVGIFLAAFANSLGWKG